MLRIRGYNRTVWAFALLLALALAALSSAAAKPRAKRALVPASEAVETVARLEQPFAAPARFFTIKQVLAKLDAGERPGNNGEHKPETRLASLGNPATQSDAPALRGSLPLQGEEPFGLFAFRAPEGILWRKWRRLEAELAVETKTIANCRDDERECPPAARRFLKIVAAVKARQGRARIEEANRNINAVIRYVSDIAQHGELDRWTAPLATLAAGRGDCEDYAIAKYVVLREAGFPLADLRLVLVRDRAARDDHAVLAARHDGRWLILDNRRSTLSDDMELRHFVPVVALDHEGVKMFAAPYVNRTTPVVTDPTPATRIEGNELGLRGALAAELAGSSGFMVAPLLM